jgi:PBP1b-binding outer membrane lipoprotein LpoB
MKIIALSLASVLLLTGCSSLLGDESDAAACEKLATVVSAENVSLETFMPTEVAATLRAEVSPIAAGALATRVEDLATALEGSEVDVAAAGTAASEIGVRCALTGVNFDFSVIGNLIN